jgi:predicted ATPase
VLLVGQPGNGKTTLGSIIQPQVEQDGGTFLTGRFDPLEHPEPFSPFIKASTQFVARALEAGQEDSLTRIKTALSRAMDLSEIQTLISIVPILGQVFGNTSQNQKQKQKQNHGRSNFLVAFCNFMRAISHPNHPIVLFLDDLQSSDPGSLDVLKILVADKKIQGLLCIVAFRPVGVKHPFSLLLRQLETGGIQFVPVLPSPLDKTSIQEWLMAHDLGLDDDRIEPMAQVIQQGTKGNAMAIKLCLRIMESNKDIVQQTGGTPLQAGGDVKSLFKLLFMMVPSNCQRVCWVASCMGMEVDPKRLAQILPDNIPLALQEAEENGIMIYIPHAAHDVPQESQISSALRDCIITDDRDLTKGRYVFSNSTLKDCVYNLISDDDKKVQHTAIGNIYRGDIITNSKNVIMGIGIGIYRVVAHLRLGIDLLSPKGKEAFAKLCLQAGEHTSEWSEFVAAAKYLDLGIQLLDEKQKWKGQYELSIALYNASADVASCTGRYDEMDARLAEVLANAKDPLDKMRAYSIQMHSLSARTLHADALALGLKVLPKLGEAIPIRKNKSVIDSEIKAVRKLLEGTNEKEIIKMSPMTDKKKLGAMKILNLLMASAFIAQGESVPLIACRMVRTTLQSGLTGASAVGLTALGAVLCAQGDIEVGTWCSELALHIVDQLEDKSCKGRVMAIHWGILTRFQKTWKVCQEPLKVSYRLCMEVGDNEVRNTHVDCGCR